MVCHRAKHPPVRAATENGRPGSYRGAGLWLHRTGCVNRTGPVHQIVAGMTLITLHSRIHFASDVLEEALRAEMDEQGLTSALLLCPAAHLGGELLTRVEAGLASCPRTTLHVIEDDESKYETAAAARVVEAEAPVDVIIAFGSADCIARGRKCRHELATLRYKSRKVTSRDGVSQKALQPKFFVIPNIDGMPDPCLEANTQINFKTTPPGVIICDPTVISDAEEAEAAKAIALTMGRCLNVLNAETFNPLADGLAIDAISRIRSIHDISKGQKDPQSTSRDLMAATLNGAIALQKGTGLVEALRFSFAKSVGRDVDSALLHRVMLARMLGNTRSSKTGVVARVLGLPSDAALPDFAAALMDDLPLPQTLQQMQIDWAELEQAIGYMEPKFGIPQINSRAELTQVLQDVY